jgi:hypothetical protein
MKRNFVYIGWLLLVAAGTFCLGEDFTVRVLNANNEHPLRKESVSISLFYANGDATPAKYDGVMKLRTDRNGEAQFRLPDPSPAKVSIKVRLRSGHWRVQDWAMVPTRDLMQTGVVQEPESSDTESPTAPKPGVALFLARPVSMAGELVSPVWRVLKWPFHWL